jgi:CBS-domain-containing membrane protein
VDQSTQTELVATGSRRGAIAKAAIIVISTFSASAGVLIMSTLASKAELALSFVPFTTSIALVAGAPMSKPATTRAILIGHFSSAIVGVLTVRFLGTGNVSGAIAVGIAVAVMLMAQAFHPPAAISPLIICEYNLGPYFIVMPVLFGALLVVLLARFTAELQRRVKSSLA